jgi:hypothetical protein
MENINPQNLICRELFGVDPGKSNGGITKFSDRYETWNMKKLYETEDPFESMLQFWEYQKSICKNPLILLENITTYSGDAKGDDGGKHFGIDKLKAHYSELRLSIKRSGIQYIEVMPRSWQKYLHYYIDHEDYKVRKDRLKDIAKGNYPQLKVTSQNADALHLIEFGRKKLKYDPQWLIVNLKKPIKSIDLFK